MIFDRVGIETEGHTHAAQSAPREEDVSIDEMFSILSQRHNRRILLSFLETDDPVGRDELTVRVAAADSRTAGRTEETRRNENGHAKS